MLSEENILDLADSSSIFNNGKSYFEQGRVLDLRIEGGHITSRVRGSRDYRVVIYPPENEDYSDIDAECNCPCNDFVCKHIVATLFTLMHMPGFSKKKERSQKVSKIAPFESLSLKEIVKNANQKHLYEALNLLNEGEIAIDLQKTDNLIAYVGKEKRYKVRIFSSPFFRKKRSIFANCNCFYNHNNCEHIIAVELFLLKNQNKNALPKKFEQDLVNKFNKEKYNELIDFLGSHNYAGSREQNKNYKLLFSFEKENNGVYLKVIKKQVLKNGALGQPSPVKHRFILDNYSRFSPEEKAILNMIDEESLDYRGYLFPDSEQNYYNNSKNDEVLRNLKAIYANDSSRFENCEFADENATLRFEIIKIKEGINKGHYELQPLIKIGEEWKELNFKDITFIGKDKIWAFISSKSKYNNSEKHMIAELKGVNKPIKNLIQKVKETKIPKDYLHEFLEKGYGVLTEYAQLDFPKEIPFSEESGITPKPSLYLRDYRDSFSIELKFRYGAKEIPHDHSSDILFKDGEKGFIKIKRNLEEENKILVNLLNESLIKKDNLFTPTIDPLTWISENLPKLSNGGFEIYGKEGLSKYKIISAEPKLFLEVSSGIDWFDLKTDVSFGDKKANFKEIASALRSHERFVRLDDGSIGLLPEKWFSKLAGTVGLMERKNEREWKASSSQIKLVESLLEISDSSKVDNKYEEIKKKFKEFSGIKDTALPRNFKGELRPYQKAGYNWLNFLKEFSFGGCLADEMGLGKTIQALAMLQKEKEAGQKTSLVVVPKTLIFNWIQEIQKFTPNLKVYTHHGPNRSKNPMKIKCDIILTTYGTLRKDIELFKKIDFNYIILDESQYIKNPLSKNARSVYSLKGRYRLALTGTPIENNYFELWSQFSFLNPGLLGSMEYFKDTFVKSLDSKRTENISSSLKNLINPFILMRKKDMVATDLPEKQVNYLFCNMDNEQKEFYENWKEKYRTEIKDKIESEGLIKSRFKILEGLLRLRQICNHPKILDQSYLGESSKFELMLGKIKEATSSNHKILVFSSFVSLLKLLKHSLNKEKIPYLYMDGKTNNRKELVEKFQDDSEVKVFLISIKTGGLGLNLTAADYVLIADPWWNPAVEMQAIDRTHRIGQDKKVIVYKMIVKDSIEEKILELQEKKMDMVKNVIAQDSSIFKQLNTEEIQKLFT